MRKRFINSKNNCITFSHISISNNNWLWIMILKRIKSIFYSLNNELSSLVWGKPSQWKIWLVDSIQIEWSLPISIPSSVQVQSSVLIFSHFNSVQLLAHSDFWSSVRGSGHEEAVIREEMSSKRLCQLCGWLYYNFYELVEELKTEVQWEEREWNRIEETELFLFGYSEYLKGN